MKIAYITRKPAQDTSVYSGTTSYIYKYLNGKYEVNNIIIPVGRLHKAINLLIRLLTFNRLKYSLVDNLFNGREIQKMYSVMSKYDVLILVAQSELLGNKKFDFDSKIIHISDATYNVMLDYYFLNVPKNQKSLLDSIEKSALDKASYALLASNWALKDAQRHYNINTSKLRLDKFGANMPDLYRPDKKINRKSINLLLVGVDWKRKGVDTAVKTLKILNRTTNFNFKLTIVGINISKKKKKKYSKSKIYFIDRIDKTSREGVEKLSNIYNNSDIFILPTQAECAGIVFCEASMFGLPSITYDTGGVSDYVANGENGFLLSPECDENDFAKVISNILKRGKLDELKISSRKYYEKSLNWTNWLYSLDKIIRNKEL